MLRPVLAPSAIARSAASLTAAAEFVLRIDGLVVLKAPNNTESCPGKGEVRVKLDGFRISRGSILKEVATGLTVLDANATQISIVSSRVCRRRLGANPLHELRIQLLRDGVGYFGFDGKDIIKLAVVTVGPQVSIGACVDQLHIHADLVG